MALVENSTTLTIGNSEFPVSSLDISFKEPHITIIEPEYRYEQEGDHVGCIQESHVCKQIQDLITQHLIDCKEFKEIIAYHDFRSFHEVIQCRCGETWKINDRLVKNECSEKWDAFWKFLTSGKIRSDNTYLMEQLNHKRTSDLMKNIADKADKEAARQAEIERDRAATHRKKMTHPILCLELE